MKYFYYGTLFFLILIIGSCESNKDAGNNSPQKIGFKIDPALLSEPYHDSALGMIFSPPKGCSQMPGDMVFKIKNQLKTQAAMSVPFTIEPHQVFLNEENHFACLLSRLPSLANSDSAVCIYRQAILDTSSVKQVKQTVFLHNGFTIYQILTIDQKKIEFKLIIPQSGNRSFQIDYVVPKSIYADYIEVIESSIGSIKKL